MTPLSAAVLSIFFFLLLAFLRLPIAISMGVVGFVGFALATSSLKAAMGLVIDNLLSTFTSYDLTVCPLFIFMGQILFKSGVGEKLFKSGYVIAGRLPGALAIGTVVGSSFFAAACGSTIATAATMGSVAIPEMHRYKYDHSLSTATCAAGGTLGILIPPSICFIIYASITQQSVGQLFVAGILPGIVLAVLFVLNILFYTWLKPGSAPAGSQTGMIEKLKAIIGLWEVLVIFIVIIGGMFAGIFTPVESASIGCLIALTFALVQRHLKWKKLLEALRETIVTATFVLLIIAMSQVFGRLMGIFKVPQLLSEWLVMLSAPPFVIILFIVGIFFIATCFIETIPIILLLVPIFLPTIQKLEIDLVWFGVVVTIVSQMGLITPPVGLNVYTIKGVSNAPLEVIFKGVWGFLIAMFVLILLLLVWPQIALFLPSFMTY